MVVNGFGSIIVATRTVVSKVEILCCYHMFHAKFAFMGGVIKVVGSSILPRALTAIPVLGV